VQAEQHTAALTKKKGSQEVKNPWSTAHSSISSPEDQIKTVQRKRVKGQRTHRAPWSKPALKQHP
jgi:hypothetical protein